ncbi:MAG: SHOCT domain-containing protein [Methylococcales bacterium]
MTKEKKMCLITTGDKFDSWRIIPYKDVLSVELFEDGNSITKAVRSSQIGSAALGGLLLGGVGAIVGGLSGKTKSSTTTNRIELRLIVNEVNNPLHDVIFLNVEAKKKDKLYIKSMQLARRWHGIIEVILKQTEDGKETTSKANEVKTHPKLSSVADEIKKLADLQSAGVLTLEEFQQQKAKLLSD